MRLLKRFKTAVGLSFLLLMVSTPAFAQNGSFQGTAFNSTGRTVGGATITVCTATGTGVPCTPLATIFSDVSGTPMSNPFTADGNGNFLFFAAPNIYKYTITGPNITAVGQPFTASVAGTGGISAATNNSFTGNNTHSGTETFKNLENIRMVEPTNAAGWAGADVGGWINSACKDLPASGGIIYVNGFTTATANNSDWAAGCTASKVTVLLGRVNLLMNQVGATTYTVQPLSGWHIVGSGPGNSYLKLNSNVSFVRMFDTPEGITDFSIENLELDGNYPIVNQGNAQNHCVMLRDAYKFAVKGNYIHNCNGSGVLVWGAGAAGTAFTNEVVSTGNGVLTTFDYTVLNPQIKPGSITVTAGAVTGTDAAQFPGVITGTGNPLNLTGSYEPGTGELRLIFASAVANGTNITINYTGGAGAQFASSNGEITGNWTKNNVTAGFGLISARDVNVHDNYDYTTISFSGIDVEPSGATQYAMNLDIHDNQMRGAAGINLTCQVQGTATLCRNNHVHHNTATAGGTIKLNRHIDTEVSGNFITNSLDPQGPLQLTGRSYTVTGNTIGPSSVLLTSTGCAAGIGLNSTSTNDTSGLPAGTGNSVIANNHVDRAYVNGICLLNSSNNLVSGNVVTNTLLNQSNANGIRLANTVANLADRNLLAANQSGDNQTVATQVNGYLFDAGVTNTKFLSNTGNGNTTNLLLDNGTGTFRLDDTNAVTLAAAQTLTNKTLSAPTVTNGMTATGTGDSNGFSFTGGIGVSVVGGGFFVTAGNGTSSASGGNINLTAGNGATGSAGAVAIIGGSGTANNLNGGSITLTPGTPNGTGVNGTVTISAAGAFLFYPSSVLFANLGTPANGALIYCSNCTFANPCAGAGTGAIAKRLNGVWVCN